MLDLIKKVNGAVPFLYKLLAVVAICIGLFTWGYSKGNDNSNSVIAKYEQQVADQGHKVANGQILVNDKIVTVYQDKIKKIYITKEHNDEIIEDVVPKSDNQFAAGWVYVHNAAATNSDADPSRAADATPSGITPNPALRVIAGNYGKCIENAAQLEALQGWIKESAVNVEEANKKKKK